MKNIVVFLVLLASLRVDAQASYPEYVVDFVQNTLTPLLPKVEAVNGKKPYRVTFDHDGEQSQITLEVLVPDANTKSSEWNVYSIYRILFAPGEVQSKEPPAIDVHRYQDKSGAYNGPALEGTVKVVYAENKLVGSPKDLEGLMRSLFRADQTLHTLFKNPLIHTPQPKVLTPPQLESLFGSLEPGNDRKGLVNFYTDHQKEKSGKPMHALLMEPTGIGKSIIALKYLEMMAKMNGGKLPHVVFVVENRGILRDFAVKIQEFFPDTAVARLFGNSASMDLKDGTRIIVISRTTFFKRKNEILAYLGRQPGQKVIYRDEAHHTGKVGGQFDKILSEIMAGFGGNTQIIDMSATPWHEDDFRLIRRYEGRVATSFATPEEYQMLINGESVDRIARIQLVRAILQGWLSPLTSLTFMTGQVGDSEGRTFRQRLIQEQRKLTEALGIEASEVTQKTLDDLTAEDVEALRDEIKRVHDPIVRELFKDLQLQFLRDRSNRVAEYDRGLIFVPTIAHAEIYQILLTEMAKASGQNMEFRPVHSKQNRGKVDVVTENVDWFNSDETSLKHRYLISVQILREGVDLPPVNRVVFASFSENIKVLLQIFGRATRLSSQKSGIRLTDMGGSYLKFFKDIPGSLLRSLFPVYDTLEGDRSSYGKFGESKPAGASIRYDGEDLSVDELKRIEVIDPMGELSQTRDRDKSRLAAKGELPKSVLDAYAQMQQHDSNYSWSVQLSPPTQNEVNGWVEAFLQFSGSFSFVGGDYLTSWNFENALKKVLLTQTEMDVKEFDELRKTQSDESFFLYALQGIGYRTSALAGRYMLGDHNGEPLLEGPRYNTIENRVLREMYKLENTAESDNSKWSSRSEKIKAQFLWEREETSKLLKFVMANWRWLSLPWEYLLDDILVEKEFYQDGKHPLLETYDYLNISANRAYLQGKELNTPLVAILNGETDFLPEEISKPLDKALGMAIDLKGQVEARVQILSLLGSSRGREMILNSPQAEALTQFLKSGNGETISVPFVYPIENSYGRGVIEREKIARKSAWAEDFRYALADPRATDLLQNFDLPVSVKFLRTKSLMVSQPFSGIEPRGSLNLLRLASMAHQLSSRTDDERRIVNAFAQPDLVEDRSLGGTYDGGSLNSTVGLFPVFRRQSRKFTGAAHVAHQDRYDYFYQQTNLDSREMEMWVDAMMIEGHAAGVIPKSLIHKTTGLLTIPRMMADGDPIPPLLLEDLISEANPILLSGQGITAVDRADGLEWLRDNRNQNSNQTLSYPSRYRISSYKTDVIAKPLDFLPSELVAENLVWIDYMKRVIVNPELEVLSYEQKNEIAKIIEAALPSFTLTQEGLQIPQSWLENSEIMLKPILKQDLPFSFENKLRASTNGVFGSNRFFMALPFYYTVTLGGNPQLFDGVGKIGSKQLEAWATHFSDKYEAELKAIDFGAYFKLPDEVLKAAYRANQEASNLKITAVNELLVSEGYSDATIARARQVLRTVNFVQHVKVRSSFEVFTSEVYTYLFQDVFARGSDRTDITPWTLMVNEFTKIELQRTAERIRNEPGSLIAARRTELGSESVSHFGESKAAEKKGITKRAGAPSCKDIF